MNVYLNDSLFTTYSDITDYYVIGVAPNDSIKFFMDDLVVPNETSSGNIALIRMADYEFSFAAVDSSYHEFCDRITGFKDETDPANTMSIYPNPGSGIFSIALNNTSGNPEVEIFNNLSVKVFHTYLNLYNTVIDLSKEAKGIYFIKINSDKKQYLQKLIIV